MRALLTVLALAAFSIALPSCSDSGGGTDAGDTTAPTIVSRSVADGETDVGLITGLSVTFSEAIDVSTIGAGSVFVSGRGPMVHISYDPGTHTLSLVPDTLLVPETWHELVLTDSITDLAGNPLAADTTDFETGPLDCEHLADRFEPNETAATATPVLLDETYPSLSVCGADFDNFSFTLDEAAKVTARTYIKYAESHGWSIQFRTTDDRLYIDSGSSANTGDTRSLAFSLFPGTYVAFVYGFSEPGHVLYDLTLETSAACEDDPFEDNDFIDEAAAITPGLHSDLRGCQYDQDFFSFAAEAGQTITVTVTQLPHGLWPHNRITFYGPSQNFIDDDDNEEMTHSLSTTAVVSGTHYVAVRFWSEVSYTLTLDVHD